MGSRPTLDDERRLLGHPHRAALLHLSRTRPGLTVAAASRHLGLDYQLVCFHAHKLARAGHLQVVHVRWHVWLFAPGTVPAQHQPAFGATREGSRRAALAAVARCPGVRLAVLAAQLGRGRSATHALLGRLRCDGLVEPAGPRGFQATAAGHEVLELLQRWAPETHAVPESHAPAQAASA